MSPIGQKKKWGNDFHRKRQQRWRQTVPPDFSACTLSWNRQQKRKKPHPSGCCLCWEQEAVCCSLRAPEASRRLSSGADFWQVLLHLSTLPPGLRFLTQPFRSLSYHHCALFLSIAHLNPNLSSFCFTGIYFFYYAACCFWWFARLGLCNWCSFSGKAGHPTTSECACVSRQLAGLASHCFHAIKL